MYYLRSTTKYNDMRRLLFIFLAIALSFTLLEGALQTQNNDKMKKLTDKELSRRIEEFVEKSLPLDAAPYIQEAKRRAMLNKDTKRMLKCLSQEAHLNSYLEDNEDILKPFVEVLPKAWTPLKQMIHTSLYKNDQNKYNELFGDSSYIDNIFDNSDGLLTTFDAGHVVDTSEYFCKLSVIDVIGFENCQIHSLKERVIDRWIELARQSGKAESLTLALGMKAQHEFEESNNERVPELSQMHKAATTPLSRVICDAFDAVINLAVINDNDIVLSDEKRTAENKRIDDYHLRFKEIVKKYPKSKLAKYLKKYITHIDNKYIDLGLEESSLPDRPLPVYIIHRNVDETTIKVRRQSDNKIVSEKTFTLPEVKNKLNNTKTYLEHNALPIGKYTIECYTGDSLRISKELYITNIAVSKVSLNKGQTLFNITNATTGAPLEGALISDKTNKTTTDKKGSAILKHISTSSNKQQVVITYGEDKVVLEPFYNWYSGESQANLDRLNNIATLTTDRMIYRPGQSISFKCYGYQTSYTKTLTFKAGELIRVKAELTDGKVIYDKTLETNLFGTVSDSISIPHDAQKGYLNIGIYHNGKYIANHSVNISDYKRTNNTISFSPITETYVCGNTLSISATCLSADMTPVANAQVTSEITLNYNDDDDKKQTLQTTTDERGVFTLEIPTKANETCAIYIYSKVTDLKGETTEGYRSLHLSDKEYRIDLSSDSYHSEADSITLQTKLLNFDSQKQDGEVHIEVYRQDIDTKAKKKAKFRGHNYRHETFDNSLVDNPVLDIYTDRESYKMTPESLIANETFAINGDQEVTLQKSLEPGLYIAKACYTSEKGVLYTATCPIKVLPNDERKCDIPEILVATTPHEVNAGKAFDIHLGSYIDEAKIRLIVKCGNKFVCNEIIDCTNNLTKKSLSIAIGDVQGNLEDIKVLCLLTHDNETYTYENSCRLVRPSRNIDVQLTTWRNVSNPGNKEHWSVKITNDQETELLATMYDTRLDLLCGKIGKPMFYIPSLQTTLSYDESLSHEYRDIRKIKGFPYSYMPNGNDIIENIINESDELMLYNTRRFVYGMYKSDAMLMTNHKKGLRITGRAANSSMMLEESTTDGVVEEESATLDTKGSTPTADKELSFSEIALRSDFRETVFFYPTLYPDTNGVAHIDFTLLDNLTNYRLRLFAHDKSLKSGYKEELLSVRKELTIKSNVPRFVREGDEIMITAEVRANNPDIKEVQCLMVVTDTATGELVDEHKIHTLTFDENTRTARTKWRLLGIADTKALKVAVSAKCDTHVDGEETLVNVLPSKTETEEGYPFVLFDKGTHTIATPDTATQHVREWRFNYASNTFMEVLKALPHLDKEHYPSTDTYLGRVESNAIAAFIKERHDVDKAINALRNNASLHSTQLKGTFYDKQNKAIEEHISKVLGMLNNDNATKERNKALRKLASMQMSNGGFPWCKGMESSDFMTAGVVEMLGWLAKYGLIDSADPLLTKICRNGVRYIDSTIKRELSKAHKGENVLGHIDNMHLLYARSYVVPQLPEVYKDSLISLSKEWKLMNIQERIMFATIMWRTGERDKAREMVRSLSQNLITTEQTAHISLKGYSCWENDIFIQSMLVMLMKEIAPEDPNNRRLVNWLMIQKRTEHWGNQQSTSRAVMALLTATADNSARDIVSLDNKEYTLTVDAPSISLNLQPSTDNKPLIATISKGSDVTSWGSWTSFSYLPMSEMKAHNTQEMQITRHMEKIDLNGNSTPITDGSLMIGDKVRITIKVKCDLAMSYVRITDYRAANLEPIDQISGYRWRWRVGNWWLATPHFYSPSDNNVTFLVSLLDRGEHTFSYETYVTHEGEMLGGYCEAECLYCRDFSIHSEATTLKAKDNREE